MMSSSINENHGENVDDDDGDHGVGGCAVSHGVTLKHLNHGE